MRIEQYMPRLATIAIALALSAHSVVPLGQAAAERPTIKYERSLLIMHKAIVGPHLDANQPCAVEPAVPDWSFAALMGGIAGNSDDAAAFIRRWLELFGQTQTLLNGASAAPRSKIAEHLLGPWGNPGSSGQVPFRLLAIVNRMDLRATPLLAGENAGEIHFVFGAIDVSPLGKCASLPMTVILEYGVRVDSLTTLKKMARTWIELSDLDPAGAEYQTNLRNLLAPVIAMNARRGAKPNGSAIDQIRTNEALAGDGKWEMREFRLAGGTADSPLVQANLPLTPRDELNNSQRLGNFLRGIAGAIQRQDYWVPSFLSGTPAEPLLAATALPRVLQSPWWQPTLGNPYEYSFSLNTCSGCHGGDTRQNVNFTHVNPELEPDATYERASDFLKREASGNRCVNLLSISEDDRGWVCPGQQNPDIHPLVH